MLSIRPADPEEAGAIARVHDRCWRASYTGMLPDPVVAASRLADREALWRDLLAPPEGARCAFVATDAGAGLVGCAWGGPEESGDPYYRAELLGLYLLAPYRRRGLGRGLVSAVAARLRRQGHAALLLWALAANHPARHFYEALGGRVLRERTIALRGFPVAEVAYAWPDIRTLIDPAAPAAPPTPR